MQKKLKQAKSSLRFFNLLLNHFAQLLIVICRHNRRNARPKITIGTTRDYADYG